MIYSDFDDIDKTSATVTTITEVFNPTTGQTTDSTTTTTTTGIFYKNSSSNQLIASKISDKATATYIVSADSAIQRTSRLTIDSIVYSIIDVDNVAFQNEAIVIGLQEY